MKETPRSLLKTLRIRQPRVRTLPFIKNQGRAALSMRQGLRKRAIVQRLQKAKRADATAIKLEAQHLTNRSLNHVAAIHHTKETVIDTKIKDTETVEEYELLFERYLGVCNRALENNKDRFPYKEIWRARVKSFGQDNVLQCAVYDDKPKIIYTLKLTEDMKIKIIKKEPVVREEVWPFKYSYLKQVVDNPQKYIEHPANLDWGWLTDVFG